ncbi:TetR/AcrR family transcriptional regulator [Lichenicola cladoniae]|uniref:TetR/AcrR family transcriptional regulator n=1 Tax=Lichenicola cladoniae TaxID=1484109 RepID=A0A6M8HVW4_9PROT|nr:TetR/AcrR family transcriptional regulator [Lichenicola cladoniae]NPD70432.1 TetR/AcrR family transcriptional regulator [Acetobacteraceae bacterium]QKE92261.1 TetR/AcrR family transcriptional regulator [Lichenicola cladoniae]
MVRTAHFSAQHFIDAAVALVAESGPRAATMQAIAHRVGAPTGSIYHRFKSRSAILATAWNASYGALARVLTPLLQAARPREAALALLPWVGEDRLRARFLLLHEPVSLFEDTPPPELLRKEMEQLESEMDHAFRACVSRIGDGMIREEDLARAKFLIFDAPVAILRSHLIGVGIVPAFAGQMIAELHAGVQFDSVITPRARDPRETLSPTSL